MVNIYFLLLVISSSMASDLCSFLDSGSVGLYRHYYRIGSEVIDSYLMFRPDSTEMWEISVESDNSNGVKIGFGDRSKEVNDLNGINKFDIIATDEVIWKCSVKKKYFEEVNEYQSTAYCTNTIITLTSKANVINDKQIVFHTNPSDPLLVISRHIKVNVFQTLSLSANKLNIVDQNLCDDRCPPFLKNMNLSLYDQMEAIVGFNTSGISGHLALFNIKGRHKYCFQTYGNENQSSTCHSLEDLKTFGPQCLINFAESSLWIQLRSLPFEISIAVPIVIALIIVIVLWYHCSKDKSRHVVIDHTENGYYRSQSFDVSVDINTSNEDMSQNDEISLKSYPLFTSVDIEPYSESPINGLFYGTRRASLQSIETDYL